MDAKELPARPNVEDFRREARERVKAMNSAKAGEGARFKLSDAQLTIAREHAFESWAKFLKHIEELGRRNSAVSKFEEAADAIVTGDLRGLKKLLKENPELVRARSTRAHGAPLIHYVAANGLENFRQKTPANIAAITKTLLRAGAEVDATTREYGAPSTALGLAATSYHPAKVGIQLELLQTLIDAGANVDGAPGGWKPAWACLHNGRGEAASFLAERGAKLNLETALGTGRVDDAKKFFDAKGKLRAGATEKQLQYGFLWACQYGHLRAVKFALKKGFDPRTQVDKHGETGLHWAAYGGFAEIVRELLKAGATVEARENAQRGTALGWALYGWTHAIPEKVARDYHAVVEELVKAGAQLDKEWIEDPNRGAPIFAMIRGDAGMRRAFAQK